jgi:hypothetical protein
MLRNYEQIFACEAFGAPTALPEGAALTFTVNLLVADVDPPSHATVSMSIERCG